MTFEQEKWSQLACDLSAFERHMTSVTLPMGQGFDMKKKQGELCQASKLVALLNDQVELVDISERPDFIIKHAGRKKGLEHVSLRNRDAIQQIGVREGFVNKAQSIFETNYPDFKPFDQDHPKCPFPLVAVELVESTDVPTKNSESLCLELANYVWGCLNARHLAKPTFIKRIHTAPHVRTDFWYKSDMDKFIPLTLKAVMYEAHRKAAKLMDYREQSGLQDHWLLMTAGELVPGSYQVGEFTCAIEDSAFERIYLLDDFNARVSRLK